MARRSSGFTLIELMVAVGIIGLLASVALPAFALLQLRARQAERVMIMSGIHRVIEDGFLRKEHFPGFDPATPESSWLWLDNNPGVFTYTATKKPWRFTSWGDHWSDLTFHPEGGLYYVYSGFGVHEKANREYSIIATGDLDSDGVVNSLERHYKYVGPLLDTSGGPANCLDCSWEDEQPPNGASY